VNKVMLLAAASGVVALASGTALAGTPSWCKGASDKEPQMYELSSKDPYEVIKVLVAAECHPNAEVEAHRAEIEKAREAWGKRLGMSEGDWADAVAYTSVHDYDIKPDMTTKKFVEMTPIDQWIAIGKAQADTQGGMDAFYVADIFDAKLSEVGRLAFIEECARTEDGILWASCQDDIDKLDYTRLYDQLRADANHGGDIRQKIRIQAYMMPERLKEHAEKVAKLKEEDPAWKKAFEIAASSRTEWATLASKNAKYLALAAEMESAFAAKSRSMFEGCDDKTFAALGEAMSTVPAKTFAKMHDVRDDPFGGFAFKALPIAVKTPSVNIASIGVALCNQRKDLAAILGSALSSTSSLRGPHNFAISKMADASLQLDDMSKKIYWPKLRHPYENSAHLATAGANIKSIKKHGDRLTVESAPMMVTTEDCVAEHVGKHIERVHDDGRVDYERICDKTAMVKHNVAWAPFEIDVRYEKLLKVGQMFSATYGDKDADVIAIWSSPNATAPSWMMGGNLK
jgi:hypothetical protein